MARDWNELERWDRAYYLHGLQAEAEHSFTGVDATDGNYIVLADGTRLLDFMSQLISDNLGHRHPAIHGALAEAMERYGHVTYTMANEYRARAAKLVIADVLGSEEWAGRLRILPSGTEAVESCIMMARLYTGRSVILSQAHSFHGMDRGRDDDAGLPQQHLDRRRLRGCCRCARIPAAWLHPDSAAGA